MAKIDQDQVVSVLNRLLEAELAGVVRYTHYSFLVFGFGRIPIVSWLREQANESLLHAQQIGEWITTLGPIHLWRSGPSSTRISTTSRRCCANRSRLNAARSSCTGNYSALSQETSSPWRSS